MKNLAIIEDDAEIRELLSSYLSNQEEFRLINVSESIEQFMDSIKDDDFPDIIISDIGLPGIQGDEGVKIIKQKCPDAEVVMLTVHDDSEIVFKCLKNGAAGYLLKNSPLNEIKNYIELLGSGGAPMSPQIARKVIDYFQPKKKVDSPLTQRENDIVQGLVEGLSYKMIADKYDIALDTVRQHIRNIYKKLNVNSKTEVITKSLKGEI